jgi:predicted DNA-binding ribbon-helix-helix protein
MSSRAPARLTSGLLSRKGMAAPSAGPESRTNTVGGAPGAPDAAETTQPQLRQGPTPARNTLADWVAPDPAGARDRSSQVAQKRIRVSLRLDEDRHTRLKLVATQRNCTLQSLFTEAIDEFFVRHAPDLHGISAHLRRGAAATAGGKSARGKHNVEGRNGPSRSR